MEKKSRAESLSHWRDIIRQCSARPEGQCAKEWLIQNSIKPDHYYYWLRIVRNEENNENNKTTDATPVFAELPISSFIPEQKNEKQSEFKPDVLITYHDCSIGVSNSASEKLVSRILGVIAHVG